MAWRDGVKDGVEDGVEDGVTDGVTDASGTASRSPPPRALVVAAFAALYVIGGSTFLGQRYVMHGGFTAFTASGLRMLTAGTIMLVWLLARGVPLAPRRAWPDLAISGTFLFVGGNAMSMIASGAVDSGLVALLTATAPFWLTIGAAQLPGGERPSPAGVFGIVLGFVGLAVIISPSLRGGGSAAGIMAAAISPVAWAIGGLWARQRLPGLPAMTIASHQMLFGTVPLLAIGLLRGEWADLHPTTSGFIALGYLVVCGNLITYNSFVFLMAHVPAAKASTYAYVNPVIAVLLGWWLAGERISSRGLIGAAAILAGVVLVNLAQVYRRGDRAAAAALTGAARRLE
jgi:drug/metabolite transporter (DMT)-like permease